MGNIRVGVVHTAHISVEDIKAQFKKQLPEVELINIVDDSLLEEVLANKAPTPGIISRMSDYYRNLQELGCSCALNQCSSVGEAADIVSKLVHIPIVKIDGPMAKQAVEIGSRVAVVATAISTVEPSSRLVESYAGQAGKDVSVSRCFVEGAFEFLLKTGDRQKHNELVIAKVKEAAGNHDVVVLAQGSMYHLIPLIGDIGVPVLTSIETGVAQIRSVLKLDK